MGTGGEARGRERGINLSFLGACLTADEEEEEEEEVRRIKARVNLSSSGGAVSDGSLHPREQRVRDKKRQIRDNGIYQHGETA